MTALWVSCKAPGDSEANPGSDRGVFRVAANTDRPQVGGRHRLGQSSAVRKDRISSEGDVLTA